MRAAALRTCVDMFGKAVDPDKNLFEINRFFVLEVTFDGQGRVAELRVQPKYWLEAEHPDWSEPDDFVDLTATEYKSLLGRLEELRPKGQLVEPASYAIATNCIAPHRDRYEYAVLETGEVVDLRRGDDAPRAIRYFAVSFHGTGAAKWPDM
jgi:hypothetical protein